MEWSPHSIVVRKVQKPIMQNLATKKKKNKEEWEEEESRKKEEEEERRMMVRFMKSYDTREGHITDCYSSGYKFAMEEEKKKKNQKV